MDISPQDRRARSWPLRAVLLAACSLPWATALEATPLELDAPIVTNPNRDGAVEGGWGAADPPAPAPLTDAPLPIAPAQGRPAAEREADIGADASDPPGQILADPIAAGQIPAGEIPSARGRSVPSASPRVLTPIDAPLTLNGRFLGVISADVDRAGDGLIDAPRLLQLLDPEIAPALRDELAARIAGRDKAPFGDLSSDRLALRFDTVALEVRAMLDPAGAATRLMRLSGVARAPEPAAFPAPAPFSLGVNVAAAQRYQHDVDQWADLAGSVDILAHVAAAGGLTLVGGFDYDGADPDGPWTRQEFRLIKDFYKSAIRATAGEFTPSADGFQGAGRIAGLGVERAYSTIRPFQNIRPAGREEFTLERDATVDVVINGLTVQTLRLKAGRYALSDFPFFNGVNEVRLVSTDVLSGRRELATFDAFSGSDLLGPGVSEFGFAAGRDEGSVAFAYDGPWVATGYYRRGLSDGLTLGANAQISEKARQVGASATLGSRLGLVLAQAAFSQDDAGGRSGFAAALNYRRDFSVRTADDVRFTASAQHLSRGFSDVFEPGRRVLEAWRVTALLQWLGPFDIGMNLGAGWSRPHDGSRDRRQLDVGLSRSFRRVSAIANLTVSDRDDGRTETRIGLGLNIPLGGRWASTGRYDSRGRRVEGTLTRYARSSVGDISGEARFLQDEEARDLSARLDYIGNRFEAEAIHNRRYDLLGGGQGAAESSLAINTFIGYAGGRIAVGRPTRDGFIIAPVHPSLREGRIVLTAGDDVIARSDGLGPPVLPIRRAYGINGFTIGVDPLPPGYDLGTGQLRVFPPFGAGYHLTIGSDASRIARGILVGPTGPLPLKPGLLEAVPPDGRPPRPVFTNRTGRFVADGLAPGRYRLTVEGLTFEFVVSQQTQGVVDVGTLHPIDR